MSGDQQHVKFAPLAEPELELDDVSIQPPPSEDSLVVSRLAHENQALRIKIVQVEMTARRSRLAAYGAGVLALGLFFVWLAEAC